MVVRPGGPARPRASSGAVFFDGDDRVLLVNPTYKDFWNLPGGGVDEGETPRAACVREIREELGLEPPIGPLLLAAWTTDAGSQDRIFFVFDGGVLDARQRAAITLDRGELHEHAFVAEADARAMLPGWQAHLLAEVIRARVDGVVRYLEIDRSLPPHLPAYAFRPDTLDRH